MYGILTSYIYFKIILIIKLFFTLLEFTSLPVYIPKNGTFTILIFNRSGTLILNICASEAT